MLQRRGITRAGTALAANLAVLAGAASMLLPIGCKPETTSRKAETSDRPAATPSAPRTANVDPHTVGTVTGAVLFRGTPPPQVSIDMSMDPACAFSENKSEQIVVNKGKLANVYLFLKGVPPSQAPAGQPPVVLDQQGCRYVPHVVAVQQGGSVEFRNSDRTMHNIHMVTTVGGNPSVDISQGAGGAPQTRQFPTPAQMVPVRCNNHPWMNAYVNVEDSPYFTLTGSAGQFSLRGLPPGTYTLAAVQEKLGEQDVQVRVTAGITTMANLTFNGQ